MLSPLDDYPVHQVAEVMRHVGTSDRNFYDRYYFNLYNTDADLFCVFGLGQYPNLGTTDVFTCVSHRDVHRVVRASRQLGEDRMDTTIGPLRVEVVEPLRKLRVVCEPSDASAEAGVELDATFEGSVPAYLEPRHFNREFERVTFDTQRLAQTGRWSGRMKVGGETHRPRAGRLVGLPRPILGRAPGRGPRAGRHPGVADPGRDSSGSTPRSSSPTTRT